MLNTSEASNEVLSESIVEYADIIAKTTPFYPPICEASAHPLAPYCRRT